VDPQLKATCRQTIYVARLASVDSFGDPTFAAAQPLRARVEDDQETQYGADEQEAKTRKRIVTEEQVLLTDRIWLPGDLPTDASKGRTPVSVQELPDELGVVDHFETIV
jgi:hypothetical protein